MEFLYSYNKEEDELMHRYLSDAKENEALQSVYDVNPDEVQKSVLQQFSTLRSKFYKCMKTNFYQLDPECSDDDLLEKIKGILFDFDFLLIFFESFFILL
jgi:hypothetical protein